jgi:TolA-binding protein
VIERRRRVESVLESMGRMVVPVPDEPEAERDQVIAAVNRRLESARGLRRSNARQRWLLTAVAAALCVCAGLAFARIRRIEPKPALARAPSPALLFKRGDALHTDANETRTGTLENGAEVQLSGGTEATVSALFSGADELVLDRGRVDLIVPKLGTKRTLSVTTPDSTVTVRGTRFSVEVLLEGAHPVTNVTVTQGSVWVRQGDSRLVLEAGTAWSSRASAASVPVPNSSGASAAASTEIAPPPSKAVAAPSAARVEAPAPPTAESSTLAEENDLYAAASRAAREGNDALAVSTLNGLLSRYPNSPMAQNARVDRFRALARSGHAQEAVAQARRYLADYPNGFARDEAKALVLQSLAKP